MEILLFFVCRLPVVRRGSSQRGAVAGDAVVRWSGCQRGKWSYFYIPRTRSMTIGIQISPKSGVLVSRFRILESFGIEIIQMAFWDTENRDYYDFGFQATIRKIIGNNSDPK